jgi:hypothetical protein
MLRIAMQAGWIERWSGISGQCAPVAQLDRASASEAEGCEFDPRRAHHYILWLDICAYRSWAESSGRIEAGYYCCRWNR